MRHAVSALIRKDLRLELRTRESVPAMALFSISTFVLFHFGLDARSLEGDLAAGVFWVTMLFAAVLAVNRQFVAERDHRHGHVEVEDLLDEALVGVVGRVEEHQREPAHEHQDGEERERDEALGELGVRHSSRR